MTHPDTKPEALECADAITQSGQFTPLKTLDSAAACLRRLHAECESLRTQLQEQALQSLSMTAQDDATIADLRTQLAEALPNARRWEWLAPRFVGADFDWQDSGVPVVVFSWPETAFISADVTESVAAAMDTMKEGE